MQDSQASIINAIITGANITIKERGFLDCWIHLDYGGLHQSFGGYTLYLPKTYTNHNVLSVAGHHIFRLMEIAGAEDWSEMTGKSIRVKRDGGIQVVSVGHIIKDDWYTPKDDFDKAFSRA